MLPTGCVVEDVIPCVVGINAALRLSLKDLLQKALLWIAFGLVTPCLVLVLFGRVVLLGNCNRLVKTFLVRVLPILVCCVIFVGVPSGLGIQDVLHSVKEVLGLPVLRGVELGTGSIIPLRPSGQVLSLGALINWL